MRTKKAKLREVAPDAKYGSVLVARLIHRSMRDGKKSVAQKQVYAGLEFAAEKLNKKPVEVLEEALKNITPQMEVRSRRVGGASYQVPMPVQPRRASSLSLRWLVLESNKRSNKEYHSYAEKLAAEILDSIENTGGAIEKKLSSHRMAEANKAFSHFRW
ncbi:MAG: 30S ribosomal protein S7 [Candidatus Pacebacteria bacterium CG10_big_fil_rev_8_21_14_0_10_36_11]|nr:30S ribosomal protein S7 [Candidatus Pacearchaeota archaeon]OIP73707.1 MAG: 30S ribosomal protein S7 [Candidatus Pacebacteria bacterium CG2_30_36_39]PIR64708.1 MAG: 30S ribosomal protein S7 [Candidatus Pacebacteria bacterium CG10_big_fil_rev_8_21_14_0_10_36_11]PJC42331.1 MAG: 30S ribosomal protein S7 [Candidatus Pacebacteria bacterium CG_4_9_14_0_2_um_filter_36_8]